MKTPMNITRCPQCGRFMNLAFVTTCRYCAAKYSTASQRNKQNERIWAVLGMLFFVFVLLVVLYSFCNALVTVYV